MNSFAPSKLILIIVGLILLAISYSGAQSRVKDVATVQGARENQLLGYGLVAGLAGQGDSDAVLPRQTISNLIKKFGLLVSEADIKSKNVAVVMVTARVSPFARNGAKIDVEVSSLADALSLQGGTLLQTPLIGADGKVYAVAQGSISVGGFLAGTGGTGGASLQKNHPTVGRIPGGALVEAEIPTNIFSHGALEINLRESDFTSAVRMANAINEQIAPLAEAVNGTTVRVFVPKEMQDETHQIEFVARIENVLFRPDVAARIVINEKTGTIVANANIRIDRVAIAQGNLTVSIVNTPIISQPNAFTGNVGSLVAGNGGNGGNGGTAAPGVVGAAATPLTVGGNAIFQNGAGNQVQVAPGTNPPAGYTLATVPGTSQAGQSAAGSVGAPGGSVTAVPGAQTVLTSQTTTQVQEEKKKFVVLDDLPTVNEVAAALNSLGVTPRDMMSIFQTMKESGALQAELILQ